jgi:hypothetical protein
MVDGFYHNSHLPHSIEAWVVGPRDDRGRAQELHQKFLQAYGLRADDVPLLVYRAERDARGEVFSFS